MTQNKTIITEAINKLGYELGCYDSMMDKLSKKELQRVVEDLKYGSTDIEVKIRRKEYVVEVMYVDSEIDFSIMTMDEYQDMVG